MSQLNLGFTLFLSLLLEATPFLLLGILVSSWLLVFVDVRKLVASFPSNPVWGVFVGSFLGLFLPVCQYGNIPVARRLLLLGIPAPTAISFLVAAPTINPISIWLTWTAFPKQPEILFWQLLCTWLMAVVIGCIFSTKISKRMRHAATWENFYSTLLDKKIIWQKRFSLLQSGSFLLPQTGERFGNRLNRIGKLFYGYKPPLKSNNGLGEQLGQFLHNSVRELVELGGVLVLGCAIAAFCQTAFPFTPIDSLTQAPTSRILSILLWGKMLSVGATAKTLFAAKIASHFTTGSLLGFLLFSSIIDIKGIGLILATFRLRVTIYLLILIWQLSFLLTLLLDFYVF